MAYTLRSLTYLLSAMDHGSISGAAEILAIAPSAVAAAIDSVERDVGLTLVRRRRAKGLSVTPEGQAFAVRARALLEEYEALLTFGDELRGRLVGKLRIGYYAPVAPAFLPRICAPMLTQNPDIAIDLVECDNDSARRGLLNGDFDAVLFVMEGPEPEMELRPMLDAPPYVLLRADDPLAGLGRLRPDMLDGRRFVLLDLPGIRSYYSALFRRAGLTPHIVATGATHEMVRSLVGAGVGCAVLNMAPLAARTYAGDAVAALPLLLEAAPAQLALGLPRGRRRRLVDVFAEACESYFASPDAQALLVR